MPRETLYKKIVESLPSDFLDHHESDLYVRLNGTSHKLVEESGLTYSVFVDEKTKHLWLDIPFAYDPYWEDKCTRLYTGDEIMWLLRQGSLKNNAIVLLKIDERGLELAEGYEKFIHVKKLKTKDFGDIVSLSYSVYHLDSEIVDSSLFANNKTRFIIKYKGEEEQCL